VPLLSSCRRGHLDFAVTPGEELILTFDVGRYRVSVWLGVPLQFAAEKEGRR
jgi:hypothetical protein